MSNVIQEGSFRSQLRGLININSVENGSNTPDFILAIYLEGCLKAFDRATNHRDKWYGKIQEPGGGAG